MLKYFYVFLLCSSLQAQIHVKRKPVEQIPLDVQNAVIQVEQRFESLLSRYCHSCLSKGCQYIAHDVVTAHSDQHLPGLTNTIDLQKNASSPAQFYLKQAVCEFAYEDHMNATQANQLKKRFRSLLSVGLLQVSISSIKLDVEDKSLQFKESLSSKLPLSDELKYWDTYILMRELWIEALPTLPYILCFLFFLILIFMMLLLLKRESVDKELLNLIQEEKSEPEDSLASMQSKSEKEFLKENQDDEEIIECLNRSHDYLLMKIKKWLACGHFENILMLEKIMKSSPLPHLPEGDLVREKYDFYQYLANHSIDIEHDKLNSFKKSMIRDLRVESFLKDSSLDVLEKYQQESSPIVTASLLNEVPLEWAVKFLSLFHYSFLKPVFPLLDLKRQEEILKESFVDLRISKKDTETLLRVLQSILDVGSVESGIQILSHPDCKASQLGKPIESSEVTSNLLRVLPEKNQFEIVRDMALSGLRTKPLRIKDIFTPFLLLRIPKHLLYKCFAAVGDQSLSGWIKKSFSSEQQEELFHDAPQSLKDLISLQASPHENRDLEYKIIQTLEGMLDDGHIHIMEII